MQRIQLNPKPSIFLCVLLAVLHLLALLAVLISALGIVIKSILMIALLASFYHCFRKYIQHKAPSSIKSCYYQNELWFIKFNSDRTVRANLQNSSYITPLVTVLNFRAVDKRQRYNLVLAFDALPRETLRQLRVVLLNRLVAFGHPPA